VAVLDLKKKKNKTKNGEAEYTATSPADRQLLWQSSAFIRHLGM
jgi:hypothetical protein